MSRPLLFGVLGVGFESGVFSLQPLSSAVTRTATLSHNGIPSAVRRPLARLVAQDEFLRVTGLAPTPPSATAGRCGIAGPKFRSRPAQPSALQHR